MANPVIRQKKSAGSGTGISISFDSLPLTGSFLLCATFNFGAAGAPGASAELPVPTDNAGTGTSAAWVKIGEYRDNDGNIINLTYNVVDGTPSGTATITPDASEFLALAIFEVTGWDSGDADGLDGAHVWSVIGTGGTAFTDLSPGLSDSLMMAFLIDQNTTTWTCTFEGASATEEYALNVGLDSNYVWSYNAGASGNYTPAVSGTGNASAIAIAIRSSTGSPPLPPVTPIRIIQSGLRF